MVSAKSLLLINLVVLVANAWLSIMLNLFSINQYGKHDRTNDANLPWDVKSNNQHFKLKHNSSKVSTNLTSVKDGLTDAYGLFDDSAYYVSYIHVWPASGWLQVTSPPCVCFSTQSSVDRLYWLAWHVKTWGGPISVAVFAPGSDYAVATEMVAYLTQCLPEVKEKVSFHIVHPHHRPPLRSRLKVDPQSLSCETPQKVNKALMTLRDPTEKSEARYPQNLMRNLARRTCPCSHSMTADMDMVPVSNMAENLNPLLTANAKCSKCTYVVPVYEISDTINYLPKDKRELLKLHANGLAQPFHIKVYLKNQGNSHLKLWEADTSPASFTASYKVLYDVSTYQEFWEPILVLHRKAPFFDERFQGYGLTRSSHVYELYLRGFQFKMLDEAFLSHRGFQTTKDYTPQRRRDIGANWQRYMVFKQELHVRLGINKHSEEPNKGQKFNNDNNNKNNNYSMWSNLENLTLKVN